MNAAPISSRADGRVTMNGFREEFSEWRKTLSDDEKQLVLKQAQGEFNKKFRKSDDFGKDLSDDKIASFGKILQKFYETEQEDYKKDADTKVPDYDALKTRAKRVTYDFSLRKRIVEVNRDADRRYYFASKKIAAAAEKGEKFPQSSPMLEIWAVQNNDTASHEHNKKVLDWLAEAAKDASGEGKKLMEDTVKAGVPAMGEPFELLIPQVMVKQLVGAQQLIHAGMEKMEAEKGKADADKFREDKLPEIFAKVIGELAGNYFDANEMIEKDVDTMKKYFRSQKNMPGKTKADVLKEIWKELPKLSNKPLPPLDEEMLSELAQEPAIIEGEFKHNWGVADKLYKSEAINSFGQKYLLGVFETKAEAEKAFDSWNAEYEKAREAMKADMQQWGKQEQARLDADTTAVDRLKKELEAARR